MVELIAKKIGLSIANSSSASTQNSHASSEHTKELIEASWQAPGRKDRIIVREINSDGVKIKRTEQENNKYIESNPDAQIGLSKFCELRPKRVKLFDHIPHYVCVCSHHENVRLLLLPQTHKMHCFTPHGKDMLTVADTSDATEFKVVSIRKVVTTISESEEEEESPQLIVNETITENNTTSEEPRSISVGQWVVVHYDGMRYPGEVTNIDGGDNQYEVRVMHRSGNHWKWPVTDDKIFYSQEDIKNNIDPPQSSRAPWTVHLL